MRIFGSRSQLTVVFIAALAAVTLATGAAGAAERTVAGLWQKVDNGKSVGWFLFELYPSSRADAKVFDQRGGQPRTHVR
jgi:hypothetical protein